MDNHTPEQRHFNMSRIKRKDTKPELIVRKYLFSRGLRYRKNEKKLLGHPDLVFPKYKTALFVHGCFWHGHACQFFKLPKTNTVFWRAKVEENKMRDKRIENCLEAAGWRVIVVWECTLKNKKSRVKTLSNLYCSITTVD